MHSLDILFSPRTVAVIGASTNPGKIGGRPIYFMQRAGFAGTIYPINRGAAEVQGLRAFPTLEAVPGPVDVAIIAVPAPAVHDAVTSCAAHGVRAAIIFSAGFGETGAVGLLQQNDLAAIARPSGMRLVGPNCLGVASVHDKFFGAFGVGFDKLEPVPGNVSIVTQSGLFGTYLAALGDEVGLGYARFITTGNEVDVDVAESIDYLARDHKTRVILASMEGCRDGRRLRAALVCAARAGKRVIFMKVGSTDIGAVAAAAHTGTLAGSDVVYDAVLRECGAYRARSVEEMLDVAVVCSRRDGLLKPSLGIVTVSGGIGILTADAAIDAGLEMPPLAPDRLATVMKAVPFAVGSNPLDTTAQFINDLSVFSTCIEQVLAGGQYGAFIALLGHTGVVIEQYEKLRGPLIAACRAHPEVLTALVMRSTPAVRKALEREGLLVMSDPTRAVRAIAALARFSKLDIAMLPVETNAQAMGTADLAGALSESAAKNLLAKAGIPILDERIARTTEEAIDAAVEIGFPVVLKIDSPDIAHKTEVGGVVLDLRDKAQVRAAFEAIVMRVHAAKPTARIHGVLVASMIREGVETILGVNIDATFGPMVMFGLGGVGVELYKDVAFASAPLTPRRAEALIDAIRGRAVLSGWRGKPPVSRAVLVDALCRLAEFAMRHETTLQSVEINPFVATDEGGFALDALIVMR